MHSSIWFSYDFEIGLNCLYEHKYQNILEYQTQTSSNYDIWSERTGLENLTISMIKDLANNCSIP